LIGQIITYREILGLPALSPEELRDRPVDELISMLGELKVAIAEKLKA
jgi:hypothetical protein